ncbi:MAG: pyridoxamine 5'-phosphate oxidase family protein [Ekhidna sp.]
MPATQPSRYPSRGTEERKTLYQIIDEGLFCTIAFIREGVPHQIPTGFARVGDDIYIHASAKSHFIESIIDELVSFSITHLDALVLAPTAFDHSFNYRSVIGFSEVEELVDEDEKLKFFNLFTDRYIPGRIADIGEPTSEQIRITKIVRLSLNNAAAKIREGDMNVRLQDETSWCGIIPLEKRYGTPEIDQQQPADSELPNYLKELVNGFSKP